MKKLFLSLFALLICSPLMGQTLAATPPMGWSSYNAFGAGITDAIVRTQAAAMVSKGLKAAGYTVVSIDGGWMNGVTEPATPLATFPDMTALATYIHTQGLQAGIYTSVMGTGTGNGLAGGVGPQTNGAPGTIGYEVADANLFAAWGFDYLFYDGNGTSATLPAPAAISTFKAMRAALDATGRPFILAINDAYGLTTGSAGTLGAMGIQVGANTWRNLGDTSCAWTTLIQPFTNPGVIFPYSEYAGPGHWGSEDSLEIGNGCMSNDEEKMQMSLWSILASPLLVGANLTTISAPSLAVLTNAEVIAVDQDAMGAQGFQSQVNGTSSVWVKPMADGTMVIGLFNLGAAAANVTVQFAPLGITGATPLRDLWNHTELGSFTGSYTATSMPSHGVVLLRTI